MPTFDDILSAPTLFTDRDVLSPHWVPANLLFRDKETERIMTAVAPALAGERARNLFIYGKTGTGKTCTVRKVMAEFTARKSSARSCYINCRMYNSRYRVIQKMAKEFIPELDRSGFGLNTLYEKLMEWVAAGEPADPAKAPGQPASKPASKPSPPSSGCRVVVILDEVDMVRDLDELLYTLTRMNDDLHAGSLSLIGITNKLSFKDALDPRSKSSLCETEMLFTPYDTAQLRQILANRASLGFKQGAVEESALNLAAAITAGETGDARYALKLLLRAGEIADEKHLHLITHAEVEAARRSVDVDLAAETISTLPVHQQLVLLAVCNLSLEGQRYARLGSTPAPSAAHEERPLMSGEVYEEYSRLCRQYKKPKRSARWYREYLNDLEMLGLITTVESGRGMRGHTRLIQPGYSPAQMKRIIEQSPTLHGPDDSQPGEPPGSPTLGGFGHPPKPPKQSIMAW
ncbi:MAG: AAA family ATPase [Candidatus Marsarchaeota archaeon]|nr:AAA family ATPase [Candidatus Marsarchaeota archaeon]